MDVSLLLLCLSEERKIITNKEKKEMLLTLNVIGLNITLT